MSADPSLLSASPSPAVTQSLESGTSLHAEPGAANNATEITSTEPVAAAADLKQAVAKDNTTVGAVVNTLDSYSVDIGNTHISLWSASVVLMVVLCVIVFARLGSKAAHWLLGKVTRLDITQQLLAEKLITISVWTLAILIGIDILQIDLTVLTVFSGAFGLAIGFGLQKTFGNLIAGMILLMDRSIKPGDVIAIADQAGNETFGQIRRIGIRAVSVTTRDEREYLIPNENLMVNQVENWSYSDKNVRIQVPVGVSYLADLKLAEELMLQAANASPRILQRPAPSVWMSEYGDSSVNFVIQCWIMDPEDGVGNVRSDVLKRLWWLFKEHNVEIPFPQRDINIRMNEQFEQLVAAIGQRDDAKRSK